jgi:tripartite-type tricarboxylate transporter receptor subunit TctC
MAKLETTCMPWLGAAVLLALSGLSALPAHADSYPGKPVRIIVSTSAGGVTDLTARIFGAYLSARSGQAVVIDNRAGAGGNIAMDAVAKSPADGYTLGVANTGNIVINPYLYRHMPYDPLHDLTPVAVIGEVPLFLVVNGKLPVQTLQDFVAYAKSHPGKISYASAGTGTTPHLTADAFVRRAGLDIVHVPYRGSAPGTMDVISGTVPMTFVSMGPHIEFVRRGDLRVLAVATSKRVAYLPDVPTFEEQGFPGFIATTWFALFAPRGTPSDIVEQLNAHMHAMAEDASSKQRLEANFVDPAPLKAAEFAELVRTDALRWEWIVRESGVKQEQ